MQNITSLNENVCTNLTRFNTTQNNRINSRTQDTTEIQPTAFLAVTHVFLLVINIQLSDFRAKPLPRSKPYSWKASIRWPNSRDQSCSFSPRPGWRVENNSGATTAISLLSLLTSVINYIYKEASSLCLWETLLYHQCTTWLPIYKNCGLRYLGLSPLL